MLLSTTEVWFSTFEQFFWTIYNDVFGTVKLNFIWPDLTKMYVGMGRPFFSRSPALLGFPHWWVGTH